MKILLTAPQPFYEERGTPIAVRWVAEALCAKGHDVDLLTYHCGRDVEMDGMQLHRAWGPPWIRSVPPGFSVRKLCCDFFLVWKMLWMVLRGHYDVIHAVEESVFPLLCLRPWLRAALVYDMDSSMADQLIEKWPWLEAFRSGLEFFERQAVRKADLVLPVCEYLAGKAAALGARGPVVILHDMAMEGDAADGAVEDLRETLNVTGPMALYVGNLEHYQGIDLLLEALRQIPEPAVTVVVIGGTQAHVEHYRTRAQALAVAPLIRWAGPRPVPALQQYLQQADILLSPRIKGGNTPLKIYSYMLAGKVILATDISSHTQVLDAACAYLAAPEPQAVAQALQALSANPDLRRRLGQTARQRALDRHTREAYTQTLVSAYSNLKPRRGRE